MSPVQPAGKLGLIVGGGPAPGINSVISSVTIEAVEKGIDVLGFQDGFKYLVKGIDNKHRKLTIDEVKGIHFRGGSVLGTARTNPTKSESDMQNVLDVFRRLGVNMLVTIGGDDTAYSGSQVYRRANGAVKVAHVPKTIDNDLPLPGSTPTFGFETARQVGVGVVHNLAEDARTTSRWYFIISMGRAAGHLALGIGKAAAATLTIIAEEFGSRRVNLDEVCDILIGAIIKRRSRGANYGIAVLAEGLLEAIGDQGLRSCMDEAELGRYGRIERDPHGHLRLGEIEFGRIVKDRVMSRLQELELDVTIIDKDLGYEMRCADPIPFDTEYTRDLGYGAVKFLRSEEASKYGAIISIVGGHLEPLPFEQMINPETGRMQARKVNVHGEGYECARRYMLRLNKEDFDRPDKLAKLAREVDMTPEQFRERFYYVVGVD